MPDLIALKYGRGGSSQEVLAEKVGHFIMHRSDLVVNSKVMSLMEKKMFLIVRANFTTTGRNNWMVGPNNAPRIGVDGSCRRKDPFR